jgi:hypothetical protein
MKSYEENKLLGGASCKNHIFLNAFALWLGNWNRSICLYFLYWWSCFDLPCSMLSE